jgi:hypothetical protein
MLVQFHSFYLVFQVSELF